MARRKASFGKFVLHFVHTALLAAVVVKFSLLFRFQSTNVSQRHTSNVEVVSSILASIRLTLFVCMPSCSLRSWHGETCLGRSNFWWDWKIGGGYLGLGATISKACKSKSRST